MGLKGLMVGLVARSHQGATLHRGGGSVVAAYNNTL